MVVSVDESEESAVLASKLGCSQLQGDSDFLTRLDWAIDDLRSSLKLITVGLDKEGIQRPVSLTAVSEGPLLDESLQGLNKELVSEVLLDKSSIVDDLSLAGTLLSNLRLLNLALVHLRLSFRSLTLANVNINVLVLVRALNEGRGLVVSPDL